MVNVRSPAGGCLAHHNGVKRETSYKLWFQPDLVLKLQHLPQPQHEVIKRLAFWLLLLNYTIEHIFACRNH